MGKICDSLCGEKNNSEQNTNGQTQTNNDIEKNDANINNNAPKLKQYDPKLLESQYSKRSVQSSYGEEILIKGNPNPDYKFKEDDFVNDDIKKLIKNKNSDKNQKPLAESFSYVKNKNNEIVPIDDNKAKTVVKSVKPIIPIMNFPNGKNTNNNNRINVSIHGSGSANNSYLYIPKKDNQPISNLENISDNYDLV